VLEDDWKPKRIVVLEFESAQRAREWLNCEEYSEPRKMRHRATRTNMILVEGHTAPSEQPLRGNRCSRDRQSWGSRLGAQIKIAFTEDRLRVCLFVSDY
jgi:hypothetical protein